MYDRSSTATCVNDARLELFACKQKSYLSIPPTRAAIVQHLKRSAYQAGYIWSQATVCQPETLSPAIIITVMILTGLCLVMLKQTLGG